MRAREAHASILRDVPLAALKRKLRQCIRKAMAQHHARMTVKVCERHIKHLSRAGASAQELMAQVDGVMRAVRAGVMHLKAYWLVQVEAWEMCRHCVEGAHDEDVRGACQALYNRATNSAEFYCLA